MASESVSGKTPGQAAYEEWARVVEGIHATGWHGLTDEDRDEWEGVAKAAAASIATLESQVDYFRELVAEILDHYAPKGSTTTSTELSWIAHWRQRAGLEPAITGAGTEHIPSCRCGRAEHDDGPTWQKLQTVNRSASRGA